MIIQEVGALFIVLDVVCGVEIEEKTAKWKSDYEGKTYYFCDPICKVEFDENPQKYAYVDNFGQQK